MEFFQLGKPLQRMRVETGKTDGYLRQGEEADDSFSQYFSDSTRVKEPDNCNYASEYINKEMEEAASGSAMGEDMSSAVHRGGIDDVEATTMSGGLADVNSLDAEATAAVFKRYDFERKNEVKLPVMRYKEQILDQINAHDVVVISGPTGSGKTTQVPQFVLDECWENGSHCNIAVTQPRRIGAITIATRVSDERHWKLGEVCGYKIGLDQCISDDTRLTYMTTGVLLQRIINCRNLDDYTHIFIDEVHERSIEMDFLLLIIRKLLRVTQSHVKIILMSATMDEDKFCAYFAKYDNTGKAVAAPRITMEERDSNYIVDVHWLEELFDLCGTRAPMVNIDMPAISNDLYELCVSIIEHLHCKGEGDPAKQTILVFLPGLAQIEEVYTRLNNSEQIKTYSFKWDIVPLHSTLPAEYQVKIFRKVPSGHKRIILATNIAESSITIPDVTYVIDFCLTKVNRTDPTTNYSGLELAWASQSNLRQRSGRVGRVSRGRVYRLIPEDMFPLLTYHATPEMLGQSLESIVLQTKLIDMGSPKEMLALAIDPPNLSNIESTVLTLKETGGMLVTCDGQYVPCDGDLTPLGRLMASLPVDIHVSKLIALGYAFGVLHQCIVIGSAMSNKSVFTSPFERNLHGYQSVREWARGSMSDHLAILNVYEVYKQKVGEGCLSRADQTNLEHWARNRFLQLRVLKEIDVLTADIKKRLSNHLIEDLGGFKVTRLQAGHDVIAIKLAIAGAFYPNYFGRNNLDHKEDRAMRELCGHNPLTSVYMTGFPPKQPGPLYAREIKKGFADCKTEMNVHFEPNATKTFIDFKPNAVALDYLEADLEEKDSSGSTSVVADGVYRALLMRKLKYTFKVHLLSGLEASSRAKTLGLQDYTVKESSEPFSDATNNLPSVSNSTIALRIIDSIQPNHFIAQYADMVDPHLHDYAYQQLHAAINLYPHLLLPLNGPPEVGGLYLGPMKNHEGFHRIRVEKIDGAKFRVLAIDLGRREQLSEQVFRRPYPEIEHLVHGQPAYALEIRLAFVQAPLALSGTRVWTNSAWSAAAEYRNSLVYGRIYSVVDGVVRLKLISPRHKLSLNEYLLKKELAVPLNESLQSVANHELRRKTHEPQMLAALDASQLPKYWKVLPTVPSPSPSECASYAMLKGPHSPLEASLYPMVRVGASFVGVNVSSDSVNAVVIDDMHSVRNDFLLVASHINRSEKSQSLTISRTTVFPTYPGIPALICLLFAPRAEYRRNKLKTRYASAIVGLGTDGKGASLYPEHDFDVIFNTLFSQEDMEDINTLRKLMSTLLESPDQSAPNLVRFRGEIQRYILKLVVQTLRPLQPEELPQHPYRWSPMAQEFTRSSDAETILPPHTLLHLLDEEEITANLKTLVAMSLRHVDFEPTLCIICDERIPSLLFLVRHLAGRDHKDKEIRLPDEENLELKEFQ